MKLLLIIVSVFFIQQVYCQMKVEQLQSEKDVIRFMNTYYPESKKDWNSVEFCHDQQSFSKNDSTVKAFYDSIKSPGFIKIDFNNDKKDDLIFCGCLGISERIIVFQSEKLGSYFPIIVSSTSNGNQLRFIKMYKNLLVTATIDLIPYNSTVNDIFKLIKYDTLAFKNNQVIEYNSKNTYYKIDSIKMSYGAGLLPKGETIIVRSTGKTEYRVHEYKSDSISNKWVNTVYNKSLLKIETQKIFTILENLPYYKYDSSYSIKAQDGYMWTTKIYFSDKRIFEIKDFMGVAPYGLRMLYKVAEKIMNDKDWKLKSSMVE